MASEILEAYPEFRKNDFVRETVGQFHVLELKARISWIAQCLRKYLPEDYRVALSILIQALPKPNNPNLTDNDFGDLIYAPYSEFVAKYGCTKKDLSASLRALRQITMRFSAEDAIRYFINAFPVESMSQLRKWCGDSNYHVRRLCSEGSRPKLPWSQKINIPAEAALPLLDLLYADKTRYVTRSVANHLNDISKVRPDLAIATLVKWKKANKQEKDEMLFIVKHATRTLVKQGNPEAMALLGVSTSALVKVSKLSIPRKVKMNSAVEFTFLLSAKPGTKLIVDYTIYFQSKRGLLDSKKVFKLSSLAIENNSTTEVSKRHVFRENMTTRKLYPGTHEIEIQVNGKKLAKTSFVLE